MKQLSSSTCQSEQRLKSLADSDSTEDLTSSINSHQLKAEIKSANESIIQDSESSAGAQSDASQPAAVVVPSEVVLFFDNLDNYFAEFGTVLAVDDINE